MASFSETPRQRPASLRSRRHTMLLGVLALVGLGLLTALELFR